MSEIMSNLDATRARIARELQQLADDIFDAHTKYAGTTTIYRSDMDIVKAQVASFRTRLQAIADTRRPLNFFRNNNEMEAFFDTLKDCSVVIDDYLNSVRNTFKNQKLAYFCEDYKVRPAHTVTNSLVIHRDRLNPQKVFYSIPRLALAIPYTVRKR